MENNLEEKQLIEIVNAHLNQLTTVSHHIADEASLRAVSGTLRFLLVEGNLLRAWRASKIGGSVTVRTWRITSTGPNKPVIALCGGGDILPGIPTSVCLNAKISEKQLNLQDFCRSARVQIDDVKITTVELISYFANALGGSHYDPSGKAAKKPKAQILRQLELGEIPGLAMRINNRSMLHHEVLSIAQAIIRSPEVGHLRSIRSAALRAA